MSEQGWIVIPNWDRFQHYRDRNPAWIKVYTELAHRDEWRQLTYAERGLLVTLWLEFALSNGTLSAHIVPTLGPGKARRKHLASLNHAGFIEVSASRPLALARARALAGEGELLRSSPKSALAREADERPARALREEKILPCPLCGVGAGHHLADCPTILERTP